MKAVLEFDLNDIDDQLAHKRAVLSTEMAIAIFEIRHNLKKKCSYKIDEDNMTNFDTLEYIFDEIYEILSEVPEDIIQ